MPPTRDSKTNDIVDVRQQHQTHNWNISATAQENQKMDNNFKPVPNGAALLAIFACYQHNKLAKEFCVRTNLFWIWLECYRLHICKLYGYVYGDLGPQVASPIDISCRIKLDTRTDSATALGRQSAICAICFVAFVLLHFSL